MDFDFKRPFFDQFRQLQLKVPRPPLVNNKSENSDFCNFSDWNRNSYLITSANRNEDSYYGFCLVDNKNAVDCLWCVNSQLLYECTDCSSCYNLRNSANCSQCIDSAFLINCRSLSNCMFCVNLRNRQYCIFNKQYSKEEYLKKEKELLEGSHLNYLGLKEKFREFLRMTPIRKANNFVSSENVQGDNIFNSKNAYGVFDVYDVNDCAYAHDGLSARDCQDIEFFEGTELCYESTSLCGRRYTFTIFCRNSANLLYCDNCHGCSDCFGCVGLRNKKFCVFNRQYSKEEYEELVPRIIEYMKGTGEWGEFFPIKYSIFAYNETLAQDYFPLAKEEALERGYPWHDDAQKQQQIQSFTVPDHIRDATDLIAGQLLRCSCGKNFKVIRQELDFYRGMNIPVPRSCPDCRHRNRMMQRNQGSLYDRACAKCKAPIRTTYAPDRTETVYCEKCWLEAVY